MKRQVLVRLGDCLLHALTCTIAGDNDLHEHPLRHVQPGHVAHAQRQAVLELADCQLR